MQINQRKVKIKRMPAYTMMTRLSRQVIFRSQEKKNQKTLDEVLALRRPAVLNAVDLPQRV